MFWKIKQCNVKNSGSNKRIIGYINRDVYWKGLKENDKERKVMRIIWKKKLINRKIIEVVMKNRGKQ